MGLMRGFALVATILTATWNGKALAGATESLRAFMAEVQTLQANFDQTLYDEDAKPLEESKGRFYLQRPDRFRWSYSVPYLQEIVADGRRVWIYDSELAQVTVKTLGNTLGNTPALLLSSDAPIEDSFFLRELGEQAGLVWLELTPRSAETSFSIVRLGFTGSELNAMELVDGFGQRTHLRFTDTVRNRELAPDLFRFTLPTGVDVITDKAEP